MRSCDLLLLSFVLGFAACSSAVSNEDRNDDSSGGRGGELAGYGGGVGGEPSVGGGGGQEAPGGQSVANENNGGASNEGGGGAAGAPPATGGAGGMEANLSPALKFYMDECSKCHGPEGKGSDLAPEILHPVREYATWVIRNGRKRPDYPGEMAKFDANKLPATMLNEIFAFLAKPSKPTGGKELYLDFCANCHGADAEGGVTMRKISAESAAEFISNTRQGHHAGEYANRRSFMPRWSATQLSDAELRAIHMYVSSL